MAYVPKRQELLNRRRLGRTSSPETVQTSCAIRRARLKRAGRQTMFRGRKILALRLNRESPVPGLTGLPYPRLARLCLGFQKVNDDITSKPWSTRETGLGCVNR